MASQASSPDLSSQLVAYLSSKHLTPNQQWLTHFLSTQRPTTPLAAVRQTALFRLINSDITSSLQVTQVNTFPPDILSPEIKSRTLPGSVPVQVLGIEDVGRSRWSQVEALEAAERGETTKGREVVRVVPGEEGLQDPETGGGGPHKLLVQDAKGTRVYAFELAGVDGVGLGVISIGTKMVLSGVAVARGLLLLEPGNVVILGGKIDELQKMWKEGRKEELKAAARAGT